MADLQMTFGKVNIINKDMIKIKYSIVLLAIAFSIQAQDSSRFTIPIKNWNMQIVGLDVFYPTYLADPLAVRFEVSSQSVKYGEIDYQDGINNGEGYNGKLCITGGMRVSLFKFSPKSNPNIGIEAELGMVLPVYMRGGNHDFMANDGIYHYSLSVKPKEWLVFRFSKHHICTHRGDEFTWGGVKSPIDFDPNIMTLYVRDDFYLSSAFRPLYFLKNKQWDILQVYADYIFFYPGVDFMGRRQNKPDAHAYNAFQMGAELEYYFPKQLFGGVYAAYNVSAYKTNSYSPNYSFVAGYIFPQDLYKKRLRVGFQYYDGRSLFNEFYNHKEKFMAFSVAMDL